MTQIISNGDKVILNSMNDLDRSSDFKTLLKMAHVMQGDSNNLKLSPENIKKLKQKLNLMEGLSGKEDVLINDTLSEEVKESEDFTTSKNEKEQLENIEGLLLNQKPFFLHKSGNLRASQRVQDVDFINNKAPYIHEKMMKKDFSEDTLQLSNQKRKSLSHLHAEKQISVPAKIAEKNNTISAIAQKKAEKNNEEIKPVKTVIKDKSYVNNADMVAINLPSSEEKTVFKDIDKDIDTVLTKKHAMVDLQPKKNSIDLESIEKQHESFSAIQTENIEDNKNIFSYRENQNSHNLNNIKNKIISSLSRVIDSDIKIDGDNKKERTIDSRNIALSNIQNPQIQPSVILPKTADKVLEIPSWKILHKKISTITQPPSITYVFKQWGSDTHQMQINFIDRQIQLVASTGRVYQSSLDNVNQYQGRFTLALNSEDKNAHWHIDAIDANADKESKKE